jgi:predicted benzoate:H+ symporter BenE
VLDAALQSSGDMAAEAQTAVLQDAIDALLLALAKDGDADARSAVNAAILTQGAARADKDRRWFAAMGFDIDYSGG